MQQLKIIEHFIKKNYNKLKSSDVKQSEKKMELLTHQEIFCFLLLRKKLLQKFIIF